MLVFVCESVLDAIKLQKQAGHDAMQDLHSNPYCCALQQPHSGGEVQEEQLSTTSAVATRVPCT